MNLSFSIRASQLGEYADCRRRAAYRALGPEGRARPGLPVSSLVGTAAHAALNAMLSAGSGQAGAAASQAAADAVEVALAGSRIVWSSGCKTPADAVRLAVFCAGSAHELAADLLQGAEVEPMLSATLRYQLPPAADDLVGGNPETLEVVLMGHPDFVHMGDRAIYDLKTGATAGGVIHQLGVYALLYNEQHGEYPDRLAVIRARPGKGASLVYYGQPRALALNAAQAARRAALTLRACHRKKSMEPAEANPSSILCSEKYCPLHATDQCPITFKESA